jgi:EAL domain-containing protein (putative c-di-GMP-specific phosphodiesterase class I)
VHLSVGLVIIADARDLTADALLLAADSALADSKDRGGDQVQSFHGEPRASVALVSAIELALAENRLTLYAQPIVDLRTSKTARLELLIRMLTAEGEIVPPGAFLPAAERFGLITDIDRWVVARALELAADGIPVAVNLSARSIGDPRILAAVAAAIDQGADPACLVVEITETAATTNLNEAREFVHALARLGCALALDDFGTGFGTFTYIKSLPAEYIKIDMEFVRQAATSTTDLEVIKSIVAIAHSLGQRTIAEGIENEQTLNLMRDLAVDFAQGSAAPPPGRAASTTTGHRSRRSSTARRGGNRGSSLTTDRGTLASGRTSPYVWQVGSRHASTSQPSKPSGRRVRAAETAQNPFL